MENERAISNHLHGESSPYLIQHASNPVDWYPWGREALEKAGCEDKPIFLSVGYSACHWCHVMAHESFEDPGIAAYMNDNFISIKVDREERPEIDHIYMQAVQAMTGRGGWPLSVFLTPEGKPFFGGTYFPPEDQRGMPGFMRILRTMKQAYVDSKGDIFEQARELQSALTVAVGRKKEILSSAILDDAAGKLIADLDKVNGGFGAAPKFPEPMALEFLLRTYRRNKDKTVLQGIVLTLDRMAGGGIYDQLGGGFHRYSTDNMWRVPHFEKMLYDNALLTGLYIHAFEATKKELYGRIACRTIDFVLREMKSSQGGFYSALDADSEGIEGKYYLWSQSEIESVAGRDAAKEVSAHYHAMTRGNFEGSNVLYVTGSEGEIPGKIVEEMLSFRKRRVRPGTDTKIVSSWNGMAVSALAEAAAVFGRQDYLQAAVSCARFMTGTMMKSGKLVHTYAGGRTGSDGYLEDYACVIQGLLDLHAASLSIDWLEMAIKLADKMIVLFLDTADGNLYDNERDSEKLFIRPRNMVDGATPCGNSSAIRALLHLFSVTGNQEYEKLADRTLEGVGKQIGAFPRGFSNWLCALDFHLSPPHEVVVCRGQKGMEPEKVLTAVFGRYLPNKVVVGTGPDDKPSYSIGLLDGRDALEGSTTIYICQGKTCRSPITSPEQLISGLDDVERQ